MLLRAVTEYMQSLTAMPPVPGLPDAGRGAASMLETLRNAQRFVFSDAASKAVEQIAEGRDALLAAQSHIFAPFDRAWIEFTAAGGEFGFMWQGDHYRDPLRQGRLLLFIRVDGGRLLPFGGLLDADRPLRFAESREAGMKFLKEIADVPADEAEKYIAFADRMVDGMTPGLLAAWALLASKGMTESVRADYTKLNKQRAAKGLYPVLGYDEIRLNVDAARVVGHDRTATATGTMPLHPVRAHLRLLASGKVTIVKAHWRGDPAMGIKSHHYTVGRDEDFTR